MIAIRWTLLVCLLLSALPQLPCAEILAIFPHTGKSHFFMFKPFVHKLVERGHHVTVVTHFTDPKPPANLTYISLEGSSEVLFNSVSLEPFEMVGKFKAQAIASIIGLSVMGNLACDTGLANNNVKALRDSGRHFDLVIVEFFNTDCFSVFAHHFKAPLVGIFSSVMMPWHNDRFGNPDNPSFVVNHFSKFPSEMSFFQRAGNTVLTYGSKIIYRIFTDWPADKTIRKHFGNDVPPVSEIVSNASLFLVNSHFSLFQPRPMVPGIVELGGMHVQPANRLPDDILKIVESSTNGVIFFSLGSTVKGSSMPEERRLAIARAFQQLPYTVLWKFEEDMPDKPNNVHVRKWFPQNDLLGHPNVKLFITHAGLMGTEEAVYHGVPMLLMPLFGDQPVNAASCEEKGVGITYDFYSLTEETFLNTIKQILTDERHAKNAKRLSAIFKDRPIGMMDNAVYWTEYVLRHEGASHLRAASAKLPWYKEQLLDVFAFFLLILALWNYGLYIIFTNLFKKTKKEKKKKN